jgi:hypothetical protein
MKLLIPLLMGAAVSCATAPHPAPPDYHALLHSLEARRIAIADRFIQDSLSRPAILEAARTEVLRSITGELLPAWYGTPWDFNGTTRTPGQGTIACGYFVTTVLLDAGFRVPRIRWAQLAAEPMIRKVAPQAKRFREADVSAVEAWLKAQGDGLYAVGLDNHVGFITVLNGEVRFVHSNYYQREIGVMAEALEGNNPFAHSHYRVIGKLLDDAMITKWLQGVPFS